MLPQVANLQVVQVVALSRPSLGMAIIEDREVFDGPYLCILVLAKATSSPKTACRDNGHANRHG